MPKTKTILILIIVALAITGISSLIKADTLLFGFMPKNTIGMGFPFHFYEVGYSSGVYNNPVSHKVLLVQLLCDIFVYLLVTASFWYLIKKGLREHNWWPLGLAVAAGIAGLIMNVGASQYCGAGFPIEFYPKCIGMNATPKIIIFGLFFDVLFWVSSSALIIAGFYSLFFSKQFGKFFVHKYFWLTVISAWGTVAIICLLSALVRLGEFAGAVIVALVLLPFLPKIRKYFKKQKQGRKIFFSRVGYIALGVSMGLITISVSFNLLYQGGWFDFTDLGFVLLSYPLIMFTHFQPDVDIFSKRIILYLISIANLLILTYILDIIGAFFIGVYKFLSNTIKFKFHAKK